MACLFLDVLQDNRRKGRFLLHEFAVMPDHFHLIVTPAQDVPLEKAVQFIKGGSLSAPRRISTSGLSYGRRALPNHRIRDPEDYGRHREYIHHNPVKSGLAKTPSEISIFVRISGDGSGPGPTRAEARFLEDVLFHGHKWPFFHNFFALKREEQRFST